MKKDFVSQGDFGRKICAPLTIIVWGKYHAGCLFDKSTRCFVDSSTSRHVDII